MTPELTLTYMSGADDGRTIRLQPAGEPPAVTIGRSPQCEVRISGDPVISRAHARLFWQGDAWWLADLGSSNGTYLREFGQSERLRQPARVGAGQIFRVGLTRLRVDSR